MICLCFRYLHTFFLFFAIHPTPKGVGFRTVFVIGDDEYPYGMPMNHFYC